MKQVLIVDDSEPIRERISALLNESDRIRVTGQAANREEALEKVETLHPDTVILDIHLPGSSGIQVLKDIKHLNPEITVIMLTNFDSAQYRRQCRRLGADHFMNKALEFNRIVDTVLGSDRR